MSTLINEQNRTMWINIKFWILITYMPLQNSFIMDNALYTCILIFLSFFFLLFIKLRTLHFLRKRKDVNTSKTNSPTSSTAFRNTTRSWRGTMAMDETLAEFVALHALRSFISTWNMSFYCTNRPKCEMTNMQDTLAFWKHEQYLHYCFNILKKQYLIFFYLC